MGGRNNSDLYATDEPREVTPAPAVDGDPFASADSLEVLRRMAQESGKAGTSRFPGRRARRHAKQLRRREERRASSRSDIHGDPSPSPNRPNHTANWCPTAEVNILLPVDRTCPACKHAV